MSTNLFISHPKEKGGWREKRTELELNLIIFSALITFVLLFIASLILMRPPQDEILEFEDEGTKSLELKGNRGTVSLRLKPSIENRTKICLTAGCVHAAAHILEMVDPSVGPCDDFYQFACGRFVKETVIPDDKTSVTVINLLVDKVKEQLRMIIEEPHSPSDSISSKMAKDLYNSCMNRSKIEELGFDPVLEIVERLGGWPVLDQQWDDSSFEWTQVIYKFRDIGFSVDYLLDFSVDADLNNSSQKIIRIGQATLSLGREYLTKSFDYKTMQAYYQYQVDVATALGANRSQAEIQMKEASLFEMKLANISLPSELRRNASNLFNPLTIAELQIKFPTIPWLQYIQRMMPFINIDVNEKVIIEVLSYVKQLEILLNSTPKRIIGNYIIWRAISSIVMYGPEKLRSAELKSTGKSEREPRWKECVDIVNNRLHHAIASQYVLNFFRSDDKKTAQDMVSGIKAEFLKILNKLSWMDDDTRMQALEKSRAMEAYIAYPDELLNKSNVDGYYNGLEINGELYLESILNISRFLTSKSFGRLRQTSLKSDWTQRQSAVVNAYYSKVENSIMLPVGILQAPFFSNERPNYLNYGAIGFVIGHEITHGFDDQGRQFDKHGHLLDWWAKNTEKKFLKKAQCIIEQYGNYTVKEVGLKLNGINTQGENIADNGGIKTAYKAYIEWTKRNGEEPSLPGLPYTPRQLFWISSANIWCSKYRPEALKLKVVTDVHATKHYRVIGALSNMDDFSKDFKCPLGSKMSPIKKCVVW